MEAAVNSTRTRIDFTSLEDSRSSLSMGEGEAAVDLEKAVHDHYKGVFRFALHLCRNSEDAADLTQFAYEQLTQKQRDIRDTTRIKAWLNAVVYRKFLDQRRKVIRFPSVPIEDEAVLPQAPAVNSPARIDARAAVAALHELEDDLRAPLSLFYIESLPYREIARILDLPIGTVMSRLHRGKEKLYNRLTGQTK